MAEKFEDKNQISELKARLFEKERIEEYLRSEVKELWKVIKVIQDFPLYSLYVRIANLYSKVVNKSKIHINSEKTDVAKNENEAIQDFDVLFIVPSNKLEIGGITTAYDLANYLNEMSLSTKVHALNFDPSGKSSQISLNSNQLKKASYSSIVVCGSEAANFVEQENISLNKKIILFMQGPDHYFEMDWVSASRFTDLISKSDLVLAISPYVASIASFYGAKNIVTASFGIDKKIFFADNGKKEKIVLVPCRANRDKGTHLVIPIINNLRKEGWKIIGFGELPDLNMAREFDDFLGRITKNELGNWFRRSKILLDPSLIEGLGLIPLEAASCGCVPIINSRNSYQGLFHSGFKPFVEVPNYLDPQLIIDKIIQIDKDNNYDAYSKTLLDLDMNSGLNNSYLAIKELLRPE
jgi:glycosyltransferase involved in cell wall biosynthesis